VTDTHTHRHTTKAYTAHSIASRGNNESRDVTTPISGTICSPYAGSSYDCDQIWNLYVDPLQRIQETLLLQRDRASHLSVEILQLQNISLENPIVWHYLRDSTFSRFDTIPECDRHTHEGIASRGKNRSYCTAHQLYNYHCRQRATVDSKMYGYYHIFER